MIQISYPFTIEFEIDRNCLASANTSSIRVYNVAQSVRRQIYKDAFATDTYKSIELKAGYGKVMPTVFKGNVRQALSVREGTNFITHIEAFDAGFAFLNGSVSKTFGKGTTQNEILDAVVKSLPAVNKGAIGDFSDTLQRGNTIAGNSAELAKQIGGGGFFVDLEKAYVLRDNECIEGPMTLIDSSMGLLGTPKREQTVVTVEMIFEPRLLIGQLIDLESTTNENFQGPHKVISIAHRGMISEAVCGSATTTVGLWIGPELLKVVKS